MNAHMQQQALDKFLQSFTNIRNGTLTIALPTGRVLHLGGQQPGHNAQLVVKDWRFFLLAMLQEDIGFTKAYMRGWVECPDLVTFGRLMVQNMEPRSMMNRIRAIATLGIKMRYFFQRNSLAGSKKNIPAHYDLGNNFYQLWLDKNMNYSSALYKNNNEDLVAAQINKNQRILDHWDKKSGKVLEIGCGWGAFAELAVNHGDYDFHGISLSHQQLAYAQRRMGNRGHMEYRDYRHLENKYDFIASIEMFEAVGREFWQSYFDAVYHSLKDKGRAVIATIYIADRFYERYTKSSDIIRTFIFPGGFLPSPTAFGAAAKNIGLKTTDVFNYGLSYAKTLKLWLDSFDSKYKAIKTLGYQDDFIRLWRCYLAFCSASFAEERIGVMQVSFEK